MRTKVYQVTVETDKAFYTDVFLTYVIARDTMDRWKAEAASRGERVLMSGILTIDA